MAILAAAVSALLPVAAYATPAISELSGTICSADGTARSIEIPGIPAPGKGAVKHVKHCPLCGGTDRLQAVAPGVAPALVAPAGDAVVPVPLHAVFFGSSVFSPARPRAPPVQS
ncbi:MAG TPA: DUF2946 family protein [Burkholderiales bacterium]|nr:DUF2946 family protein [Burkholderiales bacterium]